MCRHTITLSLLLFAANCLSAEPPGVITEFCAFHFGADIAKQNAEFNATDVVEAGVPRRRILDHAVTSTTAFLWYEHGGRGLHQHLVRFSVLDPERVQASYVFIAAPHDAIWDLLKDDDFLRAHVARDGEL
jgi:hypothetical protein